MKGSVWLAGRGVGDVNGVCEVLFAVGDAVAVFVCYVAKNWFDVVDGDGFRCCVVITCFVYGFDGEGVVCAGDVDDACPEVSRCVVCEALVVYCDA